MTRALAFALLLAAAPVAAQESGDRLPEGDPLLPGPETMEGVADILRETLARLAARLGPWREQLADVLADPGSYEPPVVLPNGDILIRRRGESEPGEEIEPRVPSPEDEDAVDL